MAAGLRATWTRHFRRLALREAGWKLIERRRIRGKQNGERYPPHRVVNFEGACNNDKTRRGSRESSLPLARPLSLARPPPLLYVFKPTKLGRK